MILVPVESFSKALYRQQRRPKRTHVEYDVTEVELAGTYNICTDANFVRSNTHIMSGNGQWQGLATSFLLQFRSEAPQITYVFSS